MKFSFPRSGTAEVNCYLLRHPRQEKYDLKENMHNSHRLQCKNIILNHQERSHYNSTWIPAFGIILREPVQ